MFVVTLSWRHAQRLLFNLDSRSPSLLRWSSFRFEPKLQEDLDDFIFCFSKSAHAVVHVLFGIAELFSHVLIRVLTFDGFQHLDVVVDP